MRFACSLRILPAAIAAAVAGCASNAASSFGSGGFSPAPLPAGRTANVVVAGGLFASIGFGISAAAANAIAAAGMAAIAIAAEGPIGAPPRMREDRAINEQDCTQPIVDPSANLRCAAR